MVKTTTWLWRSPGGSQSGQLFTAADGQPEGILRRPLPVDQAEAGSGSLRCRRHFRRNFEGGWVITFYVYVDFKSS